MTDEVFSLQLYAKAVIAAASRPTLAELGKIAMQPETREAERDRQRDYAPIKCAPVILTKHEYALNMRKWEQSLAEHPCLVGPNMRELMDSPGELTEEDTAYLKAKGWME